MANSQTSSGGYWYHCIIQVSDIVKHIEPVHDTRDVFYVCRVVDYMKTKKVNAYIMYIFGKIEQPIFFSKCITLMTSKRQRHTYFRTLEIL